MNAVSQRRLAMILLAPALLLVAFTTIYPMISSFWKRSTPIGLRPSKQADISTSDSITSRSYAVS